MTDRIPSDHDTVSTHRVSLSSVGRTSRVQLSLPAGISCEPFDIVSLSLSGRNYHSQLQRAVSGDVVVRGAFDNRRLAKADGGDNRFQEWVTDIGRGPGDSLELDILREGFAYGLRVPGERVIYEPPEPQRSSLTDIAESLEES